MDKDNARPQLSESSEGHTLDSGSVTEASTAVISAAAVSAAIISDLSDDTCTNLQLPRGRGIFELVGMWDALAPRLPPQVRA